MPEREAAKMFKSAGGEVASGSKSESESYEKFVDKESISVEDFKEMQEYFTTAKDLIVVHDDELTDVKKSLKELHNKIDRALHRLGIS